jgi:hypothetical protein
MEFLTVEARTERHIEDLGGRVPDFLDQRFNARLVNRQDPDKSETAPGAFDRTNEAINSGSESTTPSRTTDPDWFTTQIDVCFNDTSSPT